MELVQNVHDVEMQTDAQCGYDDDDDLCVFPNLPDLVVIDGFALFDGEGRLLLHQMGIDIDQEKDEQNQFDDGCDEQQYGCHKCLEY